MAHRGGALVAELVERVLALEQSAANPKGLKTGYCDLTGFTQATQAWNHDSTMENFSGVRDINMPVDLEEGQTAEDIDVLIVDLYIRATNPSYPGYSLGSSSDQAWRRLYATRHGKRTFVATCIMPDNGTLDYNKRSQLILSFTTNGNSVTSMQLKPLSGYYGTAQ